MTEKTNKAMIELTEEMNKVFAMIEAKYNVGITVDESTISIEDYD